MDFREGLRTRRSVRQYIPNRDIPADDIRDILETAMLAPSGRNKQPWEFIVVNDKSKFPEITQAQPYCRFLEEASLAVIVCGNTEEEMAPSAWMVDCAAATENLLLACHAKKLGSCWCGIYPDKERMENFIRLFNLPPHIKPLSLVVIGYPAAEPRQPEDRFKQQKIHMNSW